LRRAKKGGGREKIDNLRRQFEDGSVTINHHAHFLAARATANLHSVLDIATAFWVWVYEREREKERVVYVELVKCTIY